MVCQEILEKEVRGQILVKLPPKCLSHGRTRTLYKLKQLHTGKLSNKIFNRVCLHVSPEDIQKIFVAILDADGKLLLFYLGAFRQI